MSVSFFFFQAEDGIRDLTVTGVQTCALPILVSDVAVSLADYHGTAGEAMAMGERTPVAVLDAPASGRLAVAEAITNILAADIDSLSQVRLSANWMAACGEAGEDAALYETVRAVAKELCPQLGIAIPVGKDSLSMKTAWSEGGVEKSVVAPLSLIVSAFAPVKDVRRTLDRKSTRLNSSHSQISYAVFCLKKKNQLSSAQSFCEYPTTSLPHL